MDALCENWLNLGITTDLAVVLGFCVTTWACIRIYMLYIHLRLLLLSFLYHLSKLLPNVNLVEQAD